MIALIFFKPVITTNIEQAKSSPSIGVNVLTFIERVLCIKKSVVANYDVLTSAMDARRKSKLACYKRISIHTSRDALKAVEEK